MERRGHGAGHVHVDREVKAEEIRRRDRTRSIHRDAPWKKRRWVFNEDNFKDGRQQRETGITEHIGTSSNKI